MQLMWNLVVTLIALTGLLTLSTLSGCEQVQVESETAIVSAAVEEIAPDGAIDCPVVCVSDIAKDAPSHAGRVAVRGVVSKVFEDRRAFTIANIVEGASCCPSGCGNDTIPARVPIEHYAGDLPKQLDRVIVVGEVIPNGDGYDFVIEEVWASGRVVLKRQG